MKKYKHIKTGVIVHFVEDCATGHYESNEFHQCTGLNIRMIRAMVENSCDWLQLTDEIPLVEQVNYMNEILALRRRVQRLEEKFHI